MSACSWNRTAYTMFVYLQKNEIFSPEELPPGGLRPGDEATRTEFLSYLTTSPGRGGCGGSMVLQYK